MMDRKMSLQARRELILCVREQYQQAPWKERVKILDGFIAATSYNRKYATYLLNDKKTTAPTERKRAKLVEYDEAIQQALLTLWYAANQICSKRLLPFLPELISALERCGHLSLPFNVKQKLLKMSAATVDRLLKSERQTHKGGMSTTRPGSLIKKQIQVRAFAGWNDTVPGFFEADLVAHCGDRVDGTFLNTLVLTDIASAWTEFLPLLRRSEADVIGALQVVQKLLPFSFLGLDTDNGSEFINYELLRFCDEQKITFTRSRAYRKNDQAHVEEKNGSIVRKIVGYDRYEGEEAWKILADLYSKLRLYINFFQPSMKLISKQRDGAKIKKLYDKAQTPYQRLLGSAHISDGIKENLKKQYESLNPVNLLQELKVLQSQFFQKAWKESGNKNHSIVLESKIDDIEIDKINPDLKDCTSTNDTCSQNEIVPVQPFLQHFNQTTKPRKPLKARTWRTRADPFEAVKERLQLLVQLNPHCTAKSMLLQLIQGNPSQFNLKQLRTLQRRVNDWRTEESQQVKTPKKRGEHFLTLALATTK